MRPAVAPSFSRLPLRWVVFGALVAPYFLVFANRVAPNVLAPDLKGAFSLDAAQFGLLGSVYFWLYACMQIPAGIALDRVGARRLASSALVIAALGTAILGLAPLFGVALAGRALVGFGSSPFFISIQLTIRNWFRRRQYGSMAGLQLMIANLGALVATQPLAALAEGTSWRTSLLLLAGAMLLGALLVVVLVRNRPEDAGLPPPEDLFAPDVAARLPLWPALRIAWGVRSVWFIAAMFFLLYGVVNAFQGLWAVPYLMDTRGLVRLDAAGLVSWWAWGTVFGAPIWGLLSDRVLHTRKWTVIIGALCFGAAWTPLTLLPGLDAGLLAPLLFVAGFSAGAVVVTTPLVMELIPRQVVGTAIGLVNATPFLGAATYQALIGVALNGFGSSPEGAYPAEGYRTVFAVCLLSIVGAVALMLPVRERTAGSPG